MRDDSVTRFIPRPGSEPGRTPAQLVILEGAEPGIRYDLEAPETTLGRRADNNLVLNSSSVSKYHGRIFREGADFFIEDLGSTNGVVVNSARLEKSAVHRLCHGDTLRLSDHLLLFRNPNPLTDSKGLTTITFDAAKVRAEVDGLFKDLPGVSSNEDEG